MKNIIEKYKIKANKSLGQNFLIDENILDKISDITTIENQNILEVGPGYGVLTQKILKKNPKSLSLIELDKEMIEIIHKRIKNLEINVGNTDFKIIHNDILKYNEEKENYKVIANIPYYITSPILYNFLYIQKNKPKEMIILMQKEVGEKIISEKSSVLSLFLLKKTEIKKITVVQKSCFFPSPKVDSIVLHFKLKNGNINENDEKFVKIIKQSFLSPRKKLINNLISFGYEKKIILDFLKNNNYNENCRAEELNINDYIKLTNII